VAIHVVRLGTPRQHDEGVRLGTVRRPPRGVRKEDFGRRDFFDVWLPELAPSDALFAWARAEPFTPSRLARFSRRYRAEMRRPAAQRLIALLATLSARQNFSVGCYCADESRCHRSLLRELLQEAGAAMAEPRVGGATEAPTPDS
jgi:uncharacterized protein YeaO (DUF488 family)